jgi:hypothetical protein
MEAPADRSKAFRQQVFPVTSSTAISLLSLAAMNEPPAQTIQSDLVDQTSKHRRSIRCHRQLVERTHIGMTVKVVFRHSRVAGMDSGQELCRRTGDTVALRFPDPRVARTLPAG